MFVKIIFFTIINLFLFLNSLLQANEDSFKENIYCGGKNSEFFLKKK